MNGSWRHLLAPVALALYPVLFLYSHNQDQTYFADVVRPLTLAALGSAALLGALWLALRNLAKASTLASLAVILFFAHGHVVNVIPRAGSRAAWIAAAVEAALVAAAGVALWRVKQVPEGLSTLLAVAAAVFVAFPLVSIATHAVRRTTAAPREAAAGPAVETPAAGVRPDIYYVVLDSYASRATLGELYEYDNGPFLDALRARGFYVAEQSHSNYGATLLSLGSSLNMTYLDEMTAPYQATGDRTVLMDAVRESAVVRSLKARGYRFVNIASGFSGTDPMPGADFEMKPQKGLLNEFELLLVSTTPLAMVPALRETTDPFLLRRAAVLNAFESLGTVPEDPSPQFVLAHELTPHPPFVFDREGNMKERKGRFNQTKYSKAEYVDGYRGQVEYANGRLLEAIDRILARYPADRRPVIILQGDHGPKSLRRGKAGTEAFNRERFQILNAYLVPEGCQLYDSISPVNSFRVLFSCLFGEQLAPLPDESYFSTSRKPYNFKPVELP
jgi:hypothetical protein